MESFINIAYLIGAILFIMALKGLSHPRTAVRGNLMASVGMFIVVVFTLLDKRVLSLEVILAGVVIGSAVGAFMAIKIPMTAMPQMVALLNGFGGGASTLVAGSALLEATTIPNTQILVSTASSGIIGAVTFWGSIVAFSKLQGLIIETPVLFRGQHILNATLLILSIGFGSGLVLMPEVTPIYWAIVLTASILGVLVVIPIGGADMPAVISLLNAYSGLAAASTGFVLNNYSLIISGSLVGTSGIILTNLMCKAMNRPITNVLFGGVGAVVMEKGDIYTGRVKSASPEEVAMLLEGARRVVIVPGYGMAVSQAQFAVRDLYLQLESRGVEVEFAIHPVAGRMPGHMNVLLAEANIPYERLKGMDEINPTFEATDVSIVIGANDVVNPMARKDPTCPIGGMPILEVDRSKAVVVIKRSLSPGFAGIPNPLFADDKTLMLFRDGKKGVMEIIAALKGV